jgi:RNA polymerase sigma-70 factor, ECF subfamily
VEQVGPSSRKVPCEFPEVLSPALVMLMSDPTADLLAAQDGDPSAFRRFVEHTMLDVTRFCAYMGDRQHVDDQVQETYLRALRSLHTFRAESDARRWVIAIARRCCADAIEQQGRARRGELTRRPVNDHAVVTEINLLMSALPDDQRQAFVLTQVLGYRYDEAASVCDCPIGTIRSRVARARATLVVMMNDPSRCVG